jgi:hypothetical protein
MAGGKRINSRGGRGQGAAFYRLKPGRILDLVVTLGSQEVTLEARLSEGELKISITPPIDYEVGFSDQDGTKSYLVTLVGNDIRHQISFTVEP